MNDTNRSEYAYYHSENAWMTGHIFRRWFLEVYVPIVSTSLLSQGLPNASICFVDNFSGHGSNMVSPDGNHVILYLPPNTTSLIQPLDQEIICCLKRAYESITWEESLRSRSEESPTHFDFLKRLKTSWAVISLIKAWDDTTNRVIQHGWGKLLAPYLSATGFALDHEVTVPDTEPIDMV